MCPVDLFNGAGRGKLSLYRATSEPTRYHSFRKALVARSRIQSFKESHVCRSKYLEPHVNTDAQQKKNHRKSGMDHETGSISRNNRPTDFRAGATHFTAPTPAFIEQSNLEESSPFAQGQRSSWLDDSAERSLHATIGKF